MTMETKLRRLIRFLPVPASQCLSWTKSSIDREFRKEIKELRQTGDRTAIARKEADHFFELELISEREEELFTDRLLRKAYRLRVQIPPFPKVRGGEFEESEDWKLPRHHGSWYLTPLGVSKLRDEIHKEQKWRREGLTNWAAFLSAVTGVIGTAIGLVTVLRNYF